MNLRGILDDKGLKAVRKRNILIEAFRQGEIKLSDINSIVGIKEHDIGVILEAMESASLKAPEAMEEGWVSFAINYIDSSSNALKREAARVVGSLSAFYPDNLEGALPKLLENANDSSAVVRWSSAYALSRIIQTDKYLYTSLYAQVASIAEREEETGVKNQYLNGLKRASKKRKSR